jgi:hypothetical protein
MGIYDNIGNHHGFNSIGIFELANWIQGEIGNNNTGVSIISKPITHHGHTLCVNLVLEDNSLVMDGIVVGKST